MFNHIVGINKPTLRDHTKKKDPKSRGFQHRVSTTKPTPWDPKSCAYDRYYITGIGRSSIWIHLYPEGSCDSRTRMGSNWFVLRFYFELLSTNVLGCFKNTNIIRLFEILISLYLVDGWMGGWVDGWMDGWVGGDLLPLLIFVIFKYDNKQNELHPKTCLKVAFAY